MKDFQFETVAKKFLNALFSLVIKACFSLESSVISKKKKNVAFWLLSPDSDLIPQGYDLGIVTFIGCPSDF